MANNNFVCPHCGSDQIQRYSVAYANGISNVNTNTVGVGITKGGLGIGGAKTTGTSQTALSQSVAPPEKFNIIKWVIASVIIAPIACTLFFAIVEVVTGFSAIKIWSILNFASIVAALYYFPYRFYQYNKNVYPQEMERWQHSWLCAKCGHRFYL